MAQSDRRSKAGINGVVDARPRVTVTRCNTVRLYPIKAEGNSTMRIKQRRYDWRHQTAAIVALAIPLGLWLSPGRAHAEERGVEMITTRHGVFVSTDMPHCFNEDAGHNCTWNIGPGVDGFGGGGLSLYYGEHGHRHYVWPTSPVVGDGPNHWLERWQRREFRQHAEYRRHRPWNRCYLHVGRHGQPWVQCPNGDRYTAN